ncbi:hypothetical protein [Sinomicrobium sp. M5D2P17]
MKRTTIILTGILLFSIALIATLHGFSDDGLPERNNSFSRIFPQDPIEKGNTLDIEYNSYYMAGTTKDQLYLGNVRGYLRLLKVNPTLTDTSNILLKIKDFDQLEFKSPYVKINAPYFYMTDGVMPGLFRGKIGEWHADRFMKDSAFFINAEAVSPSKFVIRAMQADNGEYVLGKIEPEPPYLTLTPLLEKQLDGVFCVDGKLHYNKELDKLIYVYYYRNQYLVADTDLNLHYRSNTIDTFSHVRIKPASITTGKGNTKILASPPKLVNKASCTKGNLLLVHSNIMGKNDDEYLYLRSSVIDVYNLKGRSYQFSFYLPGHNRKAVRELCIIDNYLLVLYDQHIISYKLNPEYFPVQDIEGEDIKLVYTITNKTKSKNYENKTNNS